MKTALQEVKKELIELEAMAFKKEGLSRYRSGLLKAIEIINDYLQAEQSQLRAAYNNSCHDVSFEEWYNKKFKAE